MQRRREKRRESAAVQIQNISL